jgi:hypothetical protein
MATKNPNVNETWYTAKGKQVSDSAGVPISRKEVDADLENFSGKVKRNKATAKSAPELKDISDFANEGINEQIRQLRKARQTGVGAGRGEVDPNADGKKKGGMIRSKASSRADGIAQRGKTKGKYL